MKNVLKGRRAVSGTGPVNWEPCRTARNLPEIPIDRGILQRGGRRGGGVTGCGVGQGGCPDALINDCHLLHCRRAEPTVMKTVRTKLWLFARKRVMGGEGVGVGVLREMETSERGPSWKNQC